MTIKVKSAAEVAAKWAEQTPGRSAYYEAGVKGAGSDWETNTKAAAANYKSAVQAGNIDKMFAGGVAKAGAAKYTRKSVEVGVGRFSSGVTAGKVDYQSGIDGMLQTIAGITLPPRAPRGSESNLARVRAVASALHAKRLAERAAGS
jgi:hypothetical protein